MPSWRGVDIDEAPIINPDGRTHPLDLDAADAHFVDHDGVRLRTLRLRPDAQAWPEPRGSILFCPGRTEFIEKYFETFADFTGRGFNVVVLDPRGQGLSDRLLDDPIKSYVANYRDYADDLAFLADIFADDLPRPMILMGHSMGGLVVLQAVLGDTVRPDALVASAPMLGLFDIATIALKSLIRGLARFGLAESHLPTQERQTGLPVAFAANKLTSDRTRFDLWAAYFQNVAEMRVGTPTIGWLAEGLKAMSWTNRHAADLDIPALIIAPGADPIVDPNAVRAFGRKSGATTVTIPGAKHEVFLEADEYRDQFFDAFDEWLEREGF